MNCTRWTVRISPNGYICGNPYDLMIPLVGISDEITDLVDLLCDQFTAQCTARASPKGYLQKISRKSPDLTIPFSPDIGFSCNSWDDVSVFEEFFGWVDVLSGNFSSLENCSLVTSCQQISLDTAWCRLHRCWTAGRAFIIFLFLKCIIFVFEQLEIRN